MRYKNYLILATFLFFCTVLCSYAQDYIKDNQGNYRPNINLYNNYNLQPIRQQENVLIILDSSYSMSEKINGEQKIDIAKRTLNNVLSKLSPQVKLGLRVYGHKTGFMGFGACSASELLVPIGPNNIQRIRSMIVGLKPNGATPIIYSIEQALEKDFQYAGPGKKRIILLSDGMETCGGSPCDYAVDLVRKGVELKVDVIGFDLNELAAIEQLKCVALSTRGKFYSASTAAELADSLIDSLNISKEVQGKILY